MEVRGGGRRRRGGGRSGRGHAELHLDVGTAEEERRGEDKVVAVCSRDPPCALSRLYSVCRWTRTMESLDPPDDHKHFPSIKPEDFNVATRPLIFRCYTTLSQIKCSTLVS
jgi:hypothetical protein